MQAEQLRDNPSEELQEFLAIARDHSRLSESTVCKYFQCEDGSLLEVSSHAGDEVIYEITTSEDD